MQRKASVWGMPRTRTNAPNSVSNCERMQMIGNVRGGGGVVRCGLSKITQKTVSIIDPRSAFIRLNIEQWPLNGLWGRDRSWWRLTSTTNGGVGATHENWRPIEQQLQQQLTSDRIMTNEWHVSETSYNND